MSKTKYNIIKVKLWEAVIIAYKIDKDTVIIIAAGILLACSGLWKVFDNKGDQSDTVSIIVRHNETSDPAPKPEGGTTIVSTAVTLPENSENLYIDINSASIEELVKLHSIGEHIASVIIQYRESNGGFKNIEELMNVPGIGAAVFADIKEHIYVVDPVYDEPTEPETKPYAEEEVTEPITEYRLTLEDAAPININTASAELLMLLPHVGETEADEIVRLRESIGRFQSPYELLYVESLTTQEVTEIFEYITTE